MKKNKKENFLQYLDQQRSEKLAEMGCYLRHLRQEQSLSLEEVAAKTKVQARLLQAIEEGRMETLPEPVYIKGFIKRYADALGLNGSEFSSVFPTAQPFQFIKPTWHDISIGQLKPIHLYLMYVLLISTTVMGLSNLVNRSALEVGSPTTEKSPARPLPSQQDKPKPKPEPTTLASSELLSNPTPNAEPVNNAEQPNQPVRVDITLKAQSWIRVVADGKMEFEGVLPEGSQRTWMAKDQLIVRAGNAGGVVYALNEQQAQQMGAPGAVEEKTFKAN